MYPIDSYNSYNVLEVLVHIPHNLTSVYMHVNSHLQVHIHTNMHMYMHAQGNSHAGVCSYTHRRTYAETNTGTYIYSYVPSLSPTVHCFFPTLGHIDLVSWFTFTLESIQKVSKCPLGSNCDRHAPLFPAFRGCSVVLGS